MAPRELMPERYRVTSSSGTLGSATYQYDGAGLRVAKTSGGTTTSYVFSGGKVIAEYLNGAGATSPATEYHMGDQLLLTVVNSAATYHLWDHLTERTSFDSNGNIVRQNGHYPFGEQWYETGQPSKWKFTSYERDAESGNDYAMARYYVNRFGRFSSPDALSGSALDPQSLNRYAYVRNDPINYTDPSGMVTLPYFYGGIGGFGLGSTWDEFDVMMIPVVAGRASVTYEVSGDFGPNDVSNGSTTVGSTQYSWQCGPITPDGGVYGSGMNEATLTETVTLLGAPILVVPGTPITGGPVMRAATTKERALMRLQCAAEYADAQSLASHAAGGPPPSFAENLLGGNTISGLINIGLDIFGNRTPTGGEAAAVLLSGGGQGLPGGGAGFQGASGVLEEATVGEVAGQTGVDSLGPIGLAKLGYDFGTFMYGYLHVCK